MEELHKTAKAYYKTAPEDVKKLALEFFKAMDHDGDGHVSLHEFLAFMRQEGHTQMKNSCFFMELNKDGSGTLNFWEVMTLYYLVKSGRPFCEGCTRFINGLFFTCLECFECDSTTFNLCSDCFRSGKYIHEHHRFLDNFVLLEAKRRAALKAKASISETSHALTAAPTTSTSTSLAIVPVSTKPKRGKWRAALKALETGIGLGNIASNLCSIT